MKKITGTGFWQAALVALALTGIIGSLSCGGGGGGGGAATGTASVAMTDATTPDYKAVYITVERIQVHKADAGEGNWITIGTPNKTYNLLDLVNGVQQQLGKDTVPVGSYTQLRLVLSNQQGDGTKNVDGNIHPYANYFIRYDGLVHELKVPSGSQSGIKIVKGFEVTSNEITELLLDFDAGRSIVQAGNSGQWILKPTIKVLSTVEYCVIQGNSTQAGVLVSAQKYDAATGNITIAGATVSEDDGSYKLYVAPDTYTIVGYKDNYNPYYTTQAAPVAGTTYTVAAFALTDATATIGTLTGLVTVTGSSDEYPHASISIRKVAGAGMIEVKQINIGTGGTYTTILPAGTYDLFASSTGFNPKTYPVVVMVGDSTTQNISIP